MLAKIPPLFFLILLLGARVHAAGVRIERVDGQDAFAVESAGVQGLSGITWMGGDAYCAVSDHANVLQPLTIAIDRRSGRIARVEFGAPIPVTAKARDFEGIAYIAATKRFFVCAESGSAVLRCTPPGMTVETQAIPPVFARARRNLSFESITWSDALRKFWIANEEALSGDGPVSSAGAGSFVRLQQLDAKFRPLAQFAWRTEPTPMRYGNAGSGVSDLCLLPSGELLVLERGFALFGLRLRLFLAGFVRATDTSRIPALDGAKFTPAEKTLLLDLPTGLTNYEGIALGPMLDDGSRSLLLVSDNQGSGSHVFLPLKVRSTTP